MEIERYMEIERMLGNAGLLLSYEGGSDYGYGFAVGELSTFFLFADDRGVISEELGGSKNQKQEEIYQMLKGLGIPAKELHEWKKEHSCLRREAEKKSREREKGDGFGIGFTDMVLGWTLNRWQRWQ